ncbi:MAG: hypothetical protein U0L74_00205, partial [Paludibacteraceae bacterium]|nr:hypothetical protein [Paludibacteraceae bacterium]
MGTEKKIRRALFTALLSIIAVATHAATLTTSSEACVDDQLTLNASGFSSDVKYVEFYRSTDNGATWQLVRREKAENGAATVKDVMENSDVVKYKASPCGDFDPATCSLISKGDPAFFDVSKAEGCEPNNCQSSILGGYNGDGTNFDKISETDNVDFSVFPPTNLKSEFGDGVTLNMKDSPKGSLQNGWNSFSNNNFYVFDKFGNTKLFNIIYDGATYRGKTYEFCFRLYFDYTKEGCVFDEQSRNGKFKFNTYFGSTDVTLDVKVFNAATKEYLGRASGSNSNGQLEVQFGHILYEKRNEVDLFMVEVYATTNFPSGHTGNYEISFELNQYGRDKEGCPTAALDYISSVRSDDKVCFAPYDVACVGDEVCAEYDGPKPGVEQEPNWTRVNLPSGQNYEQKTKTTRVLKWYNEDENGDYQKIDEDINVSDLNPLCRIVYKEGKDRYRLEVVESILIERINFNGYNNEAEKPAAREEYDQVKTFDFYVVGEDCSAEVLGLCGDDFVCKSSWSTSKGKLHLLLSRDNNSLTYDWTITGANTGGLSVDKDGGGYVLTVQNYAVAGDYVINVYPLGSGGVGEPLASHTVTIGALDCNSVPPFSVCSGSEPSEDAVKAHILKAFGDESGTTFNVINFNYDGNNKGYHYGVVDKSNICAVYGCFLNLTQGSAPIGSLDNLVYCANEKTPELPKKLGDYEVVYQGEPSVNGNETTYSYVLQDASGCQSGTQSFTVTANDVPKAPSKTEFWFCDASQVSTSALIDSVRNYMSSTEGLDISVTGSDRSYSYKITNSGTKCSVSGDITVSFYGKPNDLTVTGFTYCPEYELNAADLQADVLSKNTLASGETLSVSGSNDSYSYIITNSNGCVTSGTLAVSRYTKPTLPALSVADFCYGTGGSIANAPSDEEERVRYSWTNANDANDKSWPNVSSTASVGSHSYSYVYTDGNGCTQSGSLNYKVHAKPTVSATFTQGGKGVDEVCPSDGGDLVVTATVENASSLDGTFEYIYNSASNGTDNVKELSYDCSTTDMSVTVQANYTPNSTSLVCQSEAVTLSIPFADKPALTCASGEPSEYNITSGCATSVTVEAPEYSSCTANATKTFVLQTKSGDTFEDSVSATDWNSLTHSLAPGEYKTIFTVSDNCLNTKTCERTFTVKDVTDPEITCKSVTQSTDAGKCDASVTLAPVISDACGIKSLTVKNGGQTVDVTAARKYTATFAKGMHSLQWTVTDVNGNYSTCTQTVTVEDNEKPVINGVADVTEVSCDGEPVSHTIDLTVTDNCTVSLTLKVNGGAAENITIDTDGKMSYTGSFPVGTTTLVWTATDGNNRAEVTQTIIVTDGRIDLPTLAMSHCSGTLPTADEAKTYLTGQLASANIEYGNDLKVTITDGVYNFSFTNEHGCPTSGVLKLSELPLPAAPKTDFTYCQEADITEKLLQSEMVKEYTNASSYTIAVTNVSGDKYSYTVTNTTTECATSGEFDVKRYAKPTAPTVTINPFCENASDKPSLPVSGAGDFSGYTINWTEQPNADLTKLGSGSHIYKYTVTDGNNCESAETSFKVDVYATPTAPEVEDMAFCENLAASDKPSLPVSKSGKFEVYTINWKEQYPEISALKASGSPYTYAYTVTDGNNC